MTFVSFRLRLNLVTTACLYLIIIVLLSLRCRARHEKAEFELGYRFVHPGGEVRDIHLVGHPVLSPSGDLVEFAGTGIYGTGRKWAEEERERLRQAQVDLAHVSRVTTMGELTASLEHEDQPIAAAVTNANTCLGGLSHDQPDLEEARSHGIGTGLSISRSIVESHGGRLWPAGNSPRGASFYFPCPPEWSPWE